MYPQTLIKIIDNSYYEDKQINSSVRIPTAMQAFASDRGTEDLELFIGEDFYKMYGRNTDFATYGQALKQVSGMIDNGGQVFCKRVVAPDATLSNLGVYVHIQRMADNSETTTVTPVVTKLTINPGSIYYFGVASASDAPTKDAVISKIQSDATVSIELSDGTTKTLTSSDYTITSAYDQSTALSEGIIDFKVSLNTSADYTNDGNLEGSVIVNVISDSESDYVSGGGSVDTSADEKTYSYTAPVVEPKYKVVLKYNAIGINTTSNDMEEVAKLFEAALPASTENDIVLPLVLFASQGRGSWTPRFRITPDYRFSRTTNHAKYLLEVIPDEGEREEEFYFSLDHVVERGRNVSLEMITDTTGENKGSSFIRVKSFTDNFTVLQNAMEDTLGLIRGSLYGMDLLFGHDVRGNQIKGIEIDASEFNLQDLYGNTLENGSNGSFGNAPLESEAYAKELVDFFNGTFCEEIYNLDAMALDFIVDADYPEDVKRAIEDFVTYREDCFFLRDLGTDVHSIHDIEIQEYWVLHNRYSSSYCNSFQVLDDIKKTYITVTISYLLAPALVVHFINGCNRPFAGIKYGLFWEYGSEIRKNSINFIPKVTPALDEKQQLEDLGVNYVSIYRSGSTRRVVLESLWTAQHCEKHTQLSWSCNVWCIQQVIKILRERCPQQRYSFMYGTDLEDYQDDLNSELSKFSSNFLSFEMEYQNDKFYEVQKIYYAVLKVKFYDFVQAEYFKIIALPTI